MGKWGQGLKIDGATKQRTVLFNLGNFTQLSHPLQDKIR